jgi:hypothetical protein
MVGLSFSNPTGNKELTYFQQPEKKIINEIDFFVRRSHSLKKKKVSIYCTVLYIGNIKKAQQGMSEDLLSWTTFF